MNWGRSCQDQCNGLADFPCIDSLWNIPWKFCLEASIISFFLQYKLEHSNLWSFFCLSARVSDLRVVNSGGDWETGSTDWSELSTLTPEGPAAATWRWEATEIRLSGFRDGVWQLLEKNLLASETWTQSGWQRQWQAVQDRGASASAGELLVAEARRTHFFVADQRTLQLANLLSLKIIKIVNGQSRCCNTEKRASN